MVSNATNKIQTMDTIDDKMNTFAIEDRHGIIKETEILKRILKVNQ